jgi:predicted nucleic acid binding AN1-type Zn finger protein
MSESINLPLITTIINASKKKKPRCLFKGCKKNTSLFSFECKCGCSFCGKHKHPEDHDCVYDHKNAGIQILRQKLVRVAGNKVIPI